MNKFKTKPYAHQLECLNKFGRKDAFALLAEMGTGKTWIIINNIADLWSTGDCDAVLVLAPNGVHSNWTRLELPKHLPDWVRYRAAAWSSSANKKEQRALDNLFSSDGELRVLTMNWEALSTKRAFEFAKKFATTAGRLMIVADESDSIKNPSTQRFKALSSLKPHSTFRRIMSGTPVNNAPFDLFSQFSFLDETILRTTSFYAFKAEYAEMLQDGHPLLKNIKDKMRASGKPMRGSPQVVARDKDKRPKYRNLEKLSALIEPHSFRVLKKDCLDLPDKIYKTLFFDLTKEQKEIYKKAAKECRLIFEGNDTPFNKLTATMKLAQITSGYYIHPLSETPVRIDGENPKLEMLVGRAKTLADAGEKTIIWARYRIEIEDIVNRLRHEGLSVVEYHGGVGRAERVETIEAFESGEAQVFVGNQQAGGTGITLVAASNVIYFSNNFSLRDRLQSEDRAHRIGQTKSVNYINIAGKGTIDEIVINVLSNKKDVADTIVNFGPETFDFTE